MQAAMQNKPVHVQTAQRGQILCRLKREALRRWWNHWKIKPGLKVRSGYRWFTSVTHGFQKVSNPDGPSLWVTISLTMKISSQLISTLQWVRPRDELSNRTNVLFWNPGGEGRTTTKVHSCGCPEELSCQRCFFFLCYLLLFLQVVSTQRINWGLDPND